MRVFPRVFHQVRLVGAKDVHGDAAGPLGSLFDDRLGHRHDHRLDDVEADGEAAPLLVPQKDRAVTGAGAREREIHDAPLELGVAGGMKGFVDFLHRYVAFLQQLSNQCHVEGRSPRGCSPASLARPLLKGARVKVQVHIKSKREVVQAFCPDLPGCSATAPSEIEALKRLRARIDEYFANETSAVSGTRVIQLEV